MMKRKIFIFIFSSLIVFSLIGQIAASFSSLSVINDFTNGIVDIDINEKQVNNETNNQTVLPYDEICKNPYITNNGSDCFVRVKLNFSNGDISNNISITGMSSDWFYNVNDGYYYYTKELKNNETVNVFNGIKIGDIDEKYQLSDFNIDIEANAVQSQNFAVDFKSASPWGDVEILKVSANNPNNKEHTYTFDTSFKIIYQDDVKGMVKNFDSFFKDVGVLLPGDSYEDTLEFQNNTNHYKELYFSNSIASNKDFLSKVSLTIFNEKNNVIFEGKLSEEKEILVDVIDSNTSKKIKFKIEVPKEIDNEFVLNTSSVKWNFSTKHSSTVLPQTGDDSPIFIYAILMIVSVIGLFISIRGVKYDKKSSQMHN